MEDRYVFVIYLQDSQPGDLREARSIASKALRLVLGSRYTRSPWLAEYRSKAQMIRELGRDDLYADAKYQVLLTPDEANRVRDAMRMIGADYGWEIPPTRMEQAKYTPGL